MEYFYWIMSGITLLMYLISLKCINKSYQKEYEKLKDKTIKINAEFQTTIMDMKVYLQWKDEINKILREKSDYYKLGYEETIRQNIELKKKLNRRTI